MIWDAATTIRKGECKSAGSQKAQKANRVRPPRTDCKQKQAGSHHRLWPGTRNSTGIENFNARQLFFYSHSGSIGISGRKSVRTEIHVCVAPCSLSILAFVLTVCRHGCPLSPDLTVSPRYSGPSAESLNVGSDEEMRPSPNFTSPEGNESQEESIPTQDHESTGDGKDHIFLPYLCAYSTAKLQDLNLASALGRKWECPSILPNE